MKEKILAQLKAKFSGVSQKALGLIADKLAKKVTEESGIDQAITDFDNAVGITDFAADLQREGDSRVTEAQKEWEKKNPKPATPPKTEEPPKGDERPQWAKELFDEVVSLKKEKAQTSIRSKAAEQLKDIPETFWKRAAVPETEEGLTEFVESIKADYSTFQQGLIDQGLMTATPPAGGGGAAAGGGGKPDAKKLDADITAWANNGKAPEKK